MAILIPMNFSSYFNSSQNHQKVQQNIETSREINFLKPAASAFFFFQNKNSSNLNHNSFTHSRLPFVCVCSFVVEVQLKLKHKSLLERKCV
jgi:hypothetical protein